MRDLPLGAVIAFDFESWNIRDEIALLGRAGIRRVQIYRNYIQGITAAHVRETLDAAGLVVDSLHGYFSLDKIPGPPCDLSSPDPAARAAALEIMRGEADFARALGCRDIVIHPVCGGNTEADPGRRTALEESTRALAALAGERQVRFLIENMPPPMFGRDAKMLRQIVDEFGGPHVGLNYDAGHAYLAGDAVGTVLEMGPRLWGIHMHDTRGKEDDHILPGMGVIPFDDVARAVSATGFDGTFIVEVYRPTEEVQRDLTDERLAHIHRLRRMASGRA